MRMKLGLENTRMTLIAAVLFVLGSIFVWRTFLRAERGPDNPAAAAVTAGANPAAKIALPARRANGPRNRWQPEPNVGRTLDPTLRFDLLKSSEDRVYAGSKRNIFAAHSEPPPAPAPACNGTLDPQTRKCIPAPVVDAGPVCPGPDPRCPPPPIGLKFFGFANRPGEPRKIFLAAGDEVFVASEGEMVLRRYRVVKISNTSVEIEDVLNNNKQQIPLTAN